MASYTLQTNFTSLAAALGVARQTMVRSLALRLHNKIVLRTPVDTGRARAGWNLAENEPVSSEPGIIQAITGDQRVFITNNVSYIEYLENGSSRQAPLGMVRISVAEVEAEADAIVRDAIRAAEGVA